MTKFFVFMVLLVGLSFRAESSEVRPPVDRPNYCMTVYHKQDLKNYQCQAQKVAFVVLEDWLPFYSEWDHDYSCTNIEMYFEIRILASMHKWDYRPIWKKSQAAWFFQTSSVARGIQKVLKISESDALQLEAQGQSTYKELVKDCGPNTLP